MIIFGRNTKNIGTKTFEINCPNCHHHQLRLTAYQSMFHFFWIPTFPYKKQYFVDCENCGSCYTKEILHEDNGGPVVHAKKERINIKTPWWAFSGTFLIAITHIYRWFLFYFH